MTKDGMKAMILSELKAAGYSVCSGGGAHKMVNEGFIEAIAAGVVAHIQAEAQVIDLGENPPASWKVL